MAGHPAPHPCTTGGPARLLKGNVTAWPLPLPFVGWEGQVMSTRAPAASVVGVVWSQVALGGPPPPPRQQAAQCLGQPWES